MELHTSYYKDLLKRFENHIISTKSIKTGNHYSGQAKSFLFFLEEIEVLSLKKVDEPIMKAYFNHLVSRPKFRGTGTLSVGTVNDNLSTLRLFSIRMQSEGVIDRGLPVPKNIRTEKKGDNEFSLVRDVLTTDEVREVFDACKSKMERALIALAYGCGLRRGNLVGLQETDIDFQSGIVVAKKAKNNNTYSIPISDYFLSVLREYSLHRLQVLSKLQGREKQFFIDDKGKTISGEKMNRILKRIIDRTGNQAIVNKHITLHCLRHSIAVHLMDAGETFEYVKSFLGHAMADTSLIYARRRKNKNKYTL